MSYLFGNPMRATAHLSNAVHQYAVEDNATVMVEYNSGVRCVVDVRWHSRVLRDEFRIRGTDGEIEMTPLNSGVLIYPGGKEELPPHQKPALSVCGGFRLSRIRWYGTALVRRDRARDHMGYR